MQEPAWSVYNKGGVMRNKAEGVWIGEGGALCGKSGAMLEFVNMTVDVRAGVSYLVLRFTDMNVSESLDAPVEGKYYELEALIG